MAMPRKKAPKLANQKPPGIVTVVSAYPEPSSAGTSSVADAHPNAPPTTTNPNSTSVLTLTPPTDMVDTEGAAPTS